MTKIIASIDTSAYAQSVIQLAAWAASKLEAHIEVLHLVQRKSAVAERKDLSGAIGLGVRSELLAELISMEEAQSKLAVRTGRALLEAAQEQLLSLGHPAAKLTTTPKHGGIVETLLELEASADLLVMGNRGASAEFAVAHLGSKLERVLRAGHKPVLIAPASFAPIKTAVLAYDGSSAATKALGLLARSQLFAQLKLEVVVVGATNPANQSLLQQALAQLETAQRPASGKLIAGNPAAVLVQELAEQPEAMLVMGAYGHSSLRNFILGSTTTELVRSVKKPILLIR